MNFLEERKLAAQEALQQEVRYEPF